MIRYFYYIVATIITSLYIFPIELVFFPAANTKMIMAVLGGTVAIMNLCLERERKLNKDIINIGICALLVSFVGVMSTLYNQTTDYTYATYVISFMVWSFAAYFVVSVIRRIHKNMTVLLLCNYLIAVCVSQCILAILLDNIPSFSSLVNNIVVGFGSMYSAGSGLEEANRLYGIGAALDVAGTRFSVVLSFIGIISYHYFQLSENKIFIFYLLLFCILLFVGCMISRTTIVGFCIVIFYWLMKNRNVVQQFWRYIISFFMLISIVVVVLYNTNDFVYNNMRFAFEYLFNWIENDSLTTVSTNALGSMYKFPESLKTWIIGDGYFNEPYVFDPYYTGEVRNWGLFYMGTDVGYLRFIYYFGVLGLFVFVLFFLNVYKTCVNRFKLYRWLFLSILISNFIIWGKVATDVYCIFALFLMITSKENEEGERLTVSD